MNGRLSKAAQRPRVFVASSSEGLDVAYSIQENLHSDAEVTVWDQDVFAPSKFGLESLVDTMENTDFGVFVFSADDVTRIRGAEARTVRDNVVFELGLFVGAIGRERNFIVTPLNDEPRLPTDLLGITVLQYMPDRTDENLRAALGPTCNRIRKMMIGLGCRRPIPEKEVIVEPSSHYDENDLLSLLESWLGGRGIGQNCSVIRYSQVDSEIGLPPGSAERLIEQAALKHDLVPDRKGAQTIQFKRQIKAKPRGIGPSSQWS